jgi:hypothetical protein
MAHGQWTPRKKVARNDGAVGVDGGEGTRQRQRREATMNIVDEEEKL